MGRRSLLKKIKYEVSNEKLTQAAGLGPMIEAFHESKLSQSFYKRLPRRTSVRSLGHKKLGLIQLSSFLYGHDCIDDLEEFRNDETLDHFFRGDLVAPRTMGDFFRDFSDQNIEGLNSFLSEFSHRVFKQFNERLPEPYKPGPLHLSIDSTSHVQHALKMEGVEYNYEGKRCLDSQRISDQMGLTYGFQLRAGNTGKGVAGKDLILHGFKGVPFSDRKYLSGDSAYMNEDCIKAAMSVGALFTFTAADTIHWTKEIPVDDSSWSPWTYSSEEMESYKKKGKEPPKVELSRYYWRPAWSDVLRLPVVIKRTWVSIEDKIKKNSTGSLFDQLDAEEKSQAGHWEHYAVMTNMPLIDFSLQEVIERHNKRGNCERFIKEEKYGFDLLHFPMLKLKANHAYGLIAQVAHNILRWLAVLERPHKPHFSKKLRRRFIYIPGKLVSHARQLVMRVPKQFYKEVQRMKMALQLEPSSAHATG